MIKAIQVWRHVWWLGHSIVVNQYRTTLAQEASDDRKGWLMKCSCGKRWAR